MSNKSGRLVPRNGLLDLLLLSETSLSTFLLSRYHVRLACLHCFSLPFRATPAGVLFALI